MALAKTPPDWTNPRSESFGDLFLKSKPKPSAPHFYSISFKIKFFNALFKFLLNCSGCTCTSWKPLPVEGLKRPVSHATRRYIFLKKLRKRLSLLLFLFGEDIFRISSCLEDISRHTRYSHFHLHISTSPHLHSFAVFSSRLSFEAVKKRSQRSLSSSASLNTEIAVHKKNIYDMIYLHIIYVYIYIQYIHYIIIFYLLYYIILHTTSPNIQVHVLMLCQSPPILCEYQITRIAKVQDKKSTRNDKNHKRIIESYKNHVFEKNIKAI